MNSKNDIEMVRDYDIIRLDWAKQEQFKET